MPKKLSQIEEEMTKEAEKASKWLKRHSKRLPQVDETRDGERPRERVKTPAGYVDRVVSLRANNDRDTNVISYGEGTKFIPIQGSPKLLSLPEIELSARVTHVMSFLTLEQHDILMGFYVEGLTWKELKVGKETKQAVYERIAWARKAFETAWVGHAEDPLEITEEDI